MRWKRGQRLKLVSESEASGPTREIFSDLRQSLGVPAVPKLYQAYAAFPKFLETHWQAFRPVVQSGQFFLLGCRLAAESYTRAHNYFEIHSFCHRDAPPQVATALSLPQTFDYYQYLDPLMLLVAAAQMQAFEEPVGQPLRNPGAAQHPRFAAEPTLLGDAQAGLEVQRSWSERKRELDLAFVCDEHRALACWPEFYVEYWSALKQLLQSPVYADCQYRLAESALGLTAELPARVETSVTQLLETGLTDEQVASIVRINEAFMRAMTGLVLDVTFARIGCEKEPHGEHPLPKPPAAEPASDNLGSPVQAA